MKNTILTFLIGLFCYINLLAQSEPSRLNKSELNLFNTFEKVGFIKVDSEDKQVLYIIPQAWATLKTNESKVNFVKKASIFYNGHKYNNWEGYGKNWILKIKIMESKKLVGEQLKDLSIKIIEEK
jgi:hypothetical protein